VDPTRVDAPTGAGRILTIPNLISFARLLGVPLFLYLFIVADHKVAAVVVLAIGGTTDWVDGYLARRLHQVSRLGELLDPLADRLYILATLLAFTVRDVIPWQFTAALLLREVVVGATIPMLRRYGYGPLPVHYVGKTATFLLLAAFPVLLLAQVSAGARPFAGPIGWGLAWWGIVLYWVAGVLYLIQFAAIVRAARIARTRDGAGDDGAGGGGATGGAAGGDGAVPA
jgi:cardiolipin synthase